MGATWLYTLGKVSPYSQQHFTKALTHMQFIVKIVLATQSCRTLKEYTCNIK